MVKCHVTLHVSTFVDSQNKFKLVLPVAWSSLDLTRDMEYIRPHHWSRQENNIFKMAALIAHRSSAAAKFTNFKTALSRISPRTLFSGTVNRKDSRYKLM